MHDKGSIGESLHVYINRARLTVCVVGIFMREISQLSKIQPQKRVQLTPIFWCWSQLDCCYLLRCGEECCHSSVRVNIVSFKIQLSTLDVGLY